MTSLEEAKSAERSGRFRDALSLLDGTRIGTERKTESDVLRMELLEHTGQHSESRAIAARLLRNGNASQSVRSACEFSLGLISLNEGESEAALVHLQRSLTFAESAQDMSRICWAQLRLMMVRATQSDSQSVVPLLAHTRWNVLRHGDPLVTAALHLFVGVLEARRGLVENARRHTQVGQHLLDSHDNPWLSSIAENTLVGIDLVRCDFDSGMRRAIRALELAEESGDAAVRRACLGNLGNLFCEAGNFGRTIEYFEQANVLLPSTGEFSIGSRDSLARTYLLQGEVEKAFEQLNYISEAVRHSNDRLLYAHRHALLTRASVLARRGEFVEALQSADLASELAKQTKDDLLAMLSHIARLELLSDVPAQGLREAGAQTAVLNGLTSCPPDVHARYERAVACSLAAKGKRLAAMSHFGRARRIYEALHSVPGIIEVNRIQQRFNLNAQDFGSTEVLWKGPTELVQDIAALLMHAGRPELAARDLIAILGGSGCVLGAAATTRAEDGSSDTLATFGQLPPRHEPSTRVLPLGTARQRQVEVTLHPKDDLESQATVQAVSTLLDIVRELERAQAEREQHLTLWPVEELPVDGDEAIVTGRMREIMTFAQKVARTSASVLITGESGTGKEIVARAIHAHSTRANKPFVPFNCTAVPRDMLESQLFGHRRGAFTGADRDYTGLIRSARDGTLFLDEIGEMGLDLQPKLLRFLESGEIAPLGEPGPLTVSVRIVAATNANLDELVRQGRFREDLFYRLNVIRLSIPPLRERRDEIPALVHHFVARAAAEFAKGRVRVSEETLDQLVLFDWPGNVRQLQNEVRRMVALVDNDAVLQPASMSPELRRATAKAAARSAPGTLAFAVAPGEKLTPAISRIEREMIRAALRASQGRVDAAARALGISRKGLYLKRQRLGL